MGGEAVVDADVEVVADFEPPAALTLLVAQQTHLGGEQQLHHTLNHRVLRQTLSYRSQVLVALVLEVVVRYQKPNLLSSTAPQPSRGLLK